MKGTNAKKQKFNLRAYYAVGPTCISGWTFAYLAINSFRQYAFGLFIWLPLVMGTVSTLIYGLNNTKERGDLFNISLTTLGVFCLGLLFFAWEGIICLIMALPVGLFFTWLGHLIGCQIIKRKIRNTGRLDLHIKGIACIRISFTIFIPALTMVNDVAFTT